MRVCASGRRAALGLVFAACLAPVAQAGHLFKGCYGGSCCDTAVQLPAQRVIVEQPVPRVAVQESYQVSRGVGVPVLGAVYMPMAFPIMGLGVGVAGTAQREVVDTAAEHNPLRSVHAAELAHLHHERARAIANAEVRAASRALERSAPGATPTREVSPDLDKQIKDLADRIDKLTERVSAVEKLTLIHDNYLREKIKKEQKPAANGD